MNPLVRLCAGRPPRSKGSKQRKRRKSTLSETAKRAKKRDEKEKAKKLQQQAEANATQATFVASMAQVTVALCTLQRLPSPVGVQSAAQQAKQRCNYSSCTMAQTAPTRKCVTCNQQHHPTCAVNAGDENLASMCALCFGEVNDNGGLLLCW